MFIIGKLFTSIFLIFNAASKSGYMGSLFNMKNLRKWSRILHRDIGFFFIGTTLIYAISGIALNHLSDWNPNYSVENKHFKTDIHLENNASVKNNILLLVVRISLWIWLSSTMSLFGFLFESGESRQFQHNCSFFYCSLYSGGVVYTGNVVVKN